MFKRQFKLLLLITWAFLAVASRPLWAPPLPPPGKVLQGPRTQVVAGTFLGRLADGRYRFGAVANVRGPDTPPEELLVRGPDWLAAWLSKGESYLFAYSAYVRNPRFRKEVLVDTDGPQLVDSPGLEPALFLDAPELKGLLLHAFDPDTLHSERFLADVIAGLRSADTQLQNFYAVELSLLSELAERKDPALLQAVKSLLDNPDGHASARAALLRLVAAHEALYSRAYLADAVQRVLAQAPLSGYQDAQPRSGELVAMALQLAAAHKLPVSMATLERLVGCDSAPLVEGALLAIRALDPARERSAAVNAMKRTQLPATSREFLLDHLRRLDLAAGHSNPATPKS